VTRLQAGRPRFDSPQAKGFFPFATLSRPALLPTRPRIQFLPGVKRPGREADHPTTSGTEVKNAWSYTSTPPYFFMTRYVSTETTLPVTYTRTVWKVRGLALLLRVGTLWRCDDGLFFEDLPWQAMHFLQRSTHFSKTCCRPFAASFRRIVEQAVLTSWSLGNFF
jgi:hypothetical protein